MIKIGAVWRGTDKEGNPMLTGSMGDARIVILKNKYKQEDKHPDYVVYIAEPPKKDKPQQEEDGPPPF